MYRGVNLTRQTRSQKAWKAQTETLDFLKESGTFLHWILDINQSFDKDEVAVEGEQQKRKRKERKEERKERVESKRGEKEGSGYREEREPYP